MGEHLGSGPVSDKGEEHSALAPPSMPTPVRGDLAGLDFVGFSAWCRGLVGFHDRFHRALFRRLMADGVWDPAAEPVWAEAERSRPGTLTTLTEAGSRCQIPEVVAERAAHDPVLGDTRKLLLRLSDGREVDPGVRRTGPILLQTLTRLARLFCERWARGSILLRMGFAMRPTLR